MLAVQRRTALADASCVNEWLHLTATARGGWRPGDDPVAMRELWRGLDRTFPRGHVSAALPDHDHTLTPDDEHDPVGAMRRVLQRHSRAFAGPGQRWELHVSRVTTRGILSRTAAYVLVNPVKHGYVEDAAQWLWSSWRDLVGATSNPGLGISSLGAALRMGRPRLVRTLNDAIVSHRTYRGTPSEPPHIVASVSHLGASFQTIANAVLASDRAGEEALFRRGVVRDRVVALADEVACGRWKDLATFLRVHESTLRRIRARPRPDISAARTCLADPRLVPPQTKA